MIFPFFQNCWCLKIRCLGAVCKYLELKIYKTATPLNEIRILVSFAGGLGQAFRMSWGDVWGGFGHTLGTSLGGAVGLFGEVICEVFRTVVVGERPITS